MPKKTEPLSEDDYPDDEVVSLPPFELEGEKISINYIREEGQDFLKPMNTQIEDAGINVPRECEIMNKTCCVEELENGDILLSPCELVNTKEPGSIRFTTVNLSRIGVTFLWFINFLEGIENVPDKCQANEKTYRAFRDFTGKLFLEEIREGTIFNVVGFSPAEIPCVLESIKKITNTER